MQMTENLGTVESTLRSVAGAGMIIFAFIGDNWINSTDILIGITIVGTILLLTGIQRTCPVFHMLGLSTR